MANGRKLITKKNHKFLDKSIYFWLAFESYYFHGNASNDSKYSYNSVLIKYKTRNIIIKTEQRQLHTHNGIDRDHMMW